MLITDADMQGLECTAFDIEYAWCLFLRTALSIYNTHTAPWHAHAQIANIFISSHTAERRPYLPTNHRPTDTYPPTMRLFSRPGSRASQRNHKDKVSVRILLGNNGAVMMSTHRVDSGPHNGIDEPQYANSELSGEIEIRVPRGSGRQRCRCIRVMLRQVTRLHMGEKRGWERDTLFERMIENRGAIILEEGVQR